MANTVNVRDNSLSNPKLPIKGEIMVAVVMMATVEDPWAVLRITARINGKNIPTCTSESCDPRISPRLLDFKILPKAPPAPVIKMIIPASFRESVTQSNRVDRFIFLLTNLRENKIPINNATKGWPKNTNISKSAPCPNGKDGYLAIDPNAMETMGSSIGAKILGAFALLSAI